MLDIQLNLVSNSLHVSQVVTGFLLLQQQEKIKLTIKNVTCLENYPHQCLVEVIINGRTKIAYDLLDGYNFNIDLVERYLKNVDFYFKRSYCSKKNKEIKGREKIYPLGFNYHLTTLNNPIDRERNPKLILKEIIKTFQKTERKRFTYEKFEYPASYDGNSIPKVIFCTRLWDPEENISEELKKEREYINSMRIKIIETLRAKLGSNFIGGITHSTYSKKYYPHLILSREITNRSKYLEILKKADICIGSMGLHESIGW